MTPTKCRAVAADLEDVLLRLESDRPIATTEDVETVRRATDDLLLAADEGDVLAEWMERHEATVLAALGLAALHYADPSMIFDAVRERYPDRNFERWISDVEQARVQMRAAQLPPSSVPPRNREAGRV